MTRRTGCLIISFLVAILMIGITAYLLSKGGLFLMSLQSMLNDQPVQGVSGYHDVTNTTFDPHFRLSLPKNWKVGYTSFPDEKTNWIYVDGPWNEAVSRLTTISLMVKERDLSQISLDELAQQSIHEKMYGEYTVAFIRPIVVSTLEAREIHVRCESMHPDINPGGYDTHQWVILRYGSYLITIHYSSSEEYFHQYFEAYTKAIESFTLLT